MAAYPAELEKRLRLRNGRMVHIRPVRSDDDLAERDFIQRLSDETRYLRFQKWVHLPTDRLVHFLTDVDHDTHLALLGMHERDGEEELVGEARYVAAPDRRSCELGIVVADDWQKSGLAGVLMDALMQAARERGLKRMEGLVLATNRPMLRFVRALGFRVEPIPEERTLVRIVKDL